MTFWGLRPPTFRVTKIVIQTEEWVERVEEMLVGLMCPVVAAVSLMVTLLEGYARHWWRAAIRSTFRGRPLSTIMWGEFLEAFLKHFISDADRATLQERFLHVRQGDRTMPCNTPYPSHSI
ncbi:hypothetical protein KSP40_PGU005095 [Platanthera guangdongensis]|uniref:Retrotransposon gag domain-containing protein n=1 Tax=Platanthera guangdongensis TaxID=2320717 RepID=A0ABR2MPG0_9ASPA